MKFTLTILTAWLVYTTGAQTWVESANKLSGAPSKKEFVLTSKIPTSDKKKELKKFPINEAFSSIFMCDFLAQIMPADQEGVSSFSTFAVAKFSFDKNGGMAYIVENRFFDVVAANSEILRHYLVTVSKDGEIISTFVLGQGGTYFFANGDFGSCAQHDDANAMYLEWESRYSMNNDFSFVVQKKFITKDVVIDDKFAITKTLAVHGEDEPTTKLKVWLDQEGEIQYTELE
jgi:hypothetical protein